MTDAQRAVVWLKRARAAGFLVKVDDEMCDVCSAAQQRDRWRKFVLGFERLDLCSHHARAVGLLW